MRVALPPSHGFSQLCRGAGAAGKRPPSPETQNTRLAAQTCSPGEDAEPTRREDTTGHLTCRELSADKGARGSRGRGFQDGPTRRWVLPAGISAGTHCPGQTRIPGENPLVAPAGGWEEEPRGDTPGGSASWGKGLRQHLSPPRKGCFPPSCLPGTWKGWTGRSHVWGAQARQPSKTWSQTVEHSPPPTDPRQQGMGAVRARHRPPPRSRREQVQRRTRGPRHRSRSTHRTRPTAAPH